MPEPVVKRLAIVVSHPIQYYAPWFRDLARETWLHTRVFYLWDFGVTATRDPQFGLTFQWDLNLLDGYEYEFVPNTARSPGTNHFFGLHNPGLLARLQDWSPDAVLAYGYGWHSLLQVALRWRQSPLILRGDTHDLGSAPGGSIRRWVRDRCLVKLFRKYAAFACVGTANRSFYARRGVPPSRLFHVPHAIDNKRFAAVTPEAALAWRRRHHVPDDHVLFLFAGKFEPKKRPDLLARAFREADLPHASLIFVGDGELAKAIDRELSPAFAMRRMGFHNQTELPVVLRAADALVLPSEGPGETWGLIVNEAMACGTPAIVSDHVGCAADLVKPGQTGWVFPAGDQPALVQALRSAAGSLARDRYAFCNATLDRISRYSFPVATEGLRHLLDSLPVKPPTRPST